MKFNKIPELLGIAITVLAVFATFSFGAISAVAATPTPTPAEIRYQQDHANCMAGKTVQGQATCIKEAGAALQAARAQELKTASPAELAANERKRCEPLSGDEKKDCLKRAAGLDTTITGSVAAGGDLKETITIVPGTPGTADSHPETAAPAGPATLPPKPGN